MADFFDKMKDGFNKSVATVSTGSKTMIEKSKISALIKSLEDEKKQLTEILGNKIYLFYTENVEGDIPRAEVVDICSGITVRNEHIEAHKRKIEELDAEMNQVMGSSQSNNLSGICQCGHTNASRAKFCGKCGSRLV